MTTPNFSDPFNTFYDQFSVHEADLDLPVHFDSYVPDNQTDYSCVSVIGPSVERGAISWTLNDKWITIGIYRDQGRPTSQRPSITGLSWTRSGFTITMTDPAGHKLHNGDVVNISNINVSMMTNVDVTLIDSYSFSFKGFVTGTTSGVNGSYQDAFLTNFYETHRVFRLLPSFKLIPYASIQSIFTATAPIPQTALKTLYNISTAQTVPIPTTTSSSSNYQLPNTNLPIVDKLPLAKRFGQIYDASGQPLQLTYLSSGYPTYVNNVDSPFKNDQVFYNVPVNSPTDPYIYVYDFYGIELNDVSRAPTYSTSNVTRNTSVIGSLNNLVVNVDYTSTLNDLFGNLAIGVQSNNALVVRKQILPLELDSFNKPVKSPI